MSARTRKRARSSPPKRKPGPGRGRKHGQTSPAIAAAAIEAGKQGGRPRDRVPAEIVKALRDLPRTTPDEIRTWCQRGLAELVLLQMEGEVGQSLAQSVRATFAALERALPAPKGRDRDSDEDDEIDDEHPGPQLEVMRGA